MTYIQVFKGGWEDPSICVTPIVFGLHGFNWVHTDMARARIQAGVFKENSKEHYDFLGIPYLAEETIPREKKEQINEQL